MNCREYGGRNQRCKGGFHRLKSGPSPPMYIGDLSVRSRSSKLSCGPS